MAFFSIWARLLGLGCVLPTLTLPYPVPAHRASAKRYGSGYKPEPAETFSFLYAGKRHDD